MPRKSADSYDKPLESDHVSVHTLRSIAPLTATGNAFNSFEVTVSRRKIVANTNHKRVTWKIRASIKNNGTAHDIHDETSDACCDYLSVRYSNVECKKLKGIRWKENTKEYDYEWNG